MAGATEPGLEERVARLEGRVDGFEDRFDALERRFDIVERRIDGLDQKLTKHFQVLATMITAVFVAVVGGLVGGFFALR